MSKYVQYGCGFSAPEQWTNYDASPTLRFERLPLLGKLYTRNQQRFPANVKYGDIVSGLPEQAGSCDGVYCSHVLEHLSYQDFIMALKNTYALLKPGGVFRGVVPDLKAAVLAYVENKNGLESPASELMRQTMLGVETRSKGLGGAIKNIYGNAKHLWMWDYPSLRFELKKAGFRDIRPAAFGDSADPYFVFVEEESRFDQAAAFECFK